MEESLYSRVGWKDQQIKRGLYKQEHWSSDPQRPRRSQVGVVWQPADNPHTWSKLVGQTSRKGERLVPPETLLRKQSRKLQGMMLAVSLGPLCVPTRVYPRTGEHESRHRHGTHTYARKEKEREKCVQSVRAYQNKNQIAWRLDLYHPQSLLLNRRLA